jgi:hypothetical protein
MLYSLYTKKLQISGSGDLAPGIAPGFFEKSEKIENLSKCFGKNHART